MQAELAFDAAHPTAAGHFPGDPIIPGAVLLAEILRVVAPVESACEVRAAKFLAPVRPGDRLTVRWSTERAGEARFEAYAAGGDIAVNGTLVLGAAAS